MNQQCSDGNSTWPSVCEFTIALLLQLVLAAPIIHGSTPNVDELGHLASGFYHWQTGRFDAYVVNPPLMRLLSTFPIVLFDSVPKLKVPSLAAHGRFEWELDDQLIELASISQILWWLAVARWVHLFTSVLGTVYCYRWARHLFGPGAGRLAALFWIFSPNILTWSCTVCTDVPATSFGLAALYHCRSERTSRWWRPLIAGLLTGLAVAAKTTWLLLFPCLTLLFVVDAFGRQRWRMLRQALAFWLTALVIVHATYGFEDLAPQGHSYCRLASQSMITETLAPLLPRTMVQGIVVQKQDFDEGQRSYLRGRWQDRGWKRYYLECFFLKTPATWCVLILWGLLQFARRLMRRPGWAANLRESLGLVVSLLTFGLTISGLSGFSQHYRYFAPCLGLLFVVAAGTLELDPRKTLILFSIGVLSGLSQWPSSHSYFNYAVGGPSRGHCFLADANLDWGEDLPRIREWIESHPECRPLHYDVANRPFALKFLPDDVYPVEQYDAPGWYLLRIQSLSDPREPAFGFRNKPCRARVGAAHGVYYQSETKMMPTSPTK